MLLAGGMDGGGGWVDYAGMPNPPPLDLKT